MPGDGSDGLDAASVQLITADNTGGRDVGGLPVASARRDALSGLLGVYSGSADAENRLLSAWESHDPTTESEIGARAATSLANWMVISGRSDQALMWADRAVDGTLQAPRCTPGLASRRPLPCPQLAGAPRGW